MKRSPRHLFDRFTGQPAGRQSLPRKPLDLEQASESALVVAPTWVGGSDKES